MTALSRQTPAKLDCDVIYDSRPGWVDGTVSLSDARYLFGRLQAHDSGAVIEIGTASGVSTAIMQLALSGSVGLVTYDIATQFYAAPEHRTGEAVETMLPPELAQRITFRSPATASDVGSDFGPNSIGFLFLDAHHGHPWPALDVLAVLEQLRPGAEIVLHDVNLPLRRPDFSIWGAKHLFDGLDIDKQLNPDDDALPNIGSCFVPEDKGRFRDQLLRILFAHEWEADIDPALIARILTRGSGEGLRAALRHALPHGSQVLVVSKGDSSLLDVPGRQAGHFPQRGDGVYAGYYPKTSEAAIEHLEHLRERGARFIVFPPTATWWLDHYAELGRHLSSHHQVVARDDTLGALFALTPAVAIGAEGVPAPPPPTRSQAPSSGSLRDLLDDSLAEPVRALFEAEHYVAQAGIDASDDDEALAHYLRAGYRRGFSPHPLFHAEWYSRRYAVEGNPLLHFVRVGLERPLDPNPYFDTAYYLEQAGGAERLARLPILHYLERAPENQCYHPNPLFRDGFYLRSYRDLPQGTIPLEHWLRAGWREARPVSELHRDMLDQLAGSSRSGLIRGNWKRGTVLFFTGADHGAAGGIAVAEAFARHMHLDAVVIAPSRAAVEQRMPGDARLLVLEDFQLAAPVGRISARRLLTKSLLTAEPLFAITESPDVLDVLAKGGVGSYVLLPESDRPPAREELLETITCARRLILPSSQAFQAVSEVLEERPARVAVRRPDAEGYAESLFELAQRDFGLEVASGLDAAVPARPPRRIVIPCSDWSVSGVNASLEALGQELTRRGWDVEILFTRDHGWVSDSAGGDAHMPSLPHRWLRRRRVGMEGLWEALISDLELKAPALVLTSYDFLGNGVLPALTDRIGTLMWVQADDGDYYEQAYRLGRYSDAIVGVSQSIRDTIVALNPALADRTYAIPNSSVRDRDIVGRRPPRGELLRIVYAGRLVQYQKRVLDYVELARSLDQTGIPYEVTLIGTFARHRSDEDGFRARAAEHLADGRIRLAGRRTREEILAQLDESDLFVLLSEFEGLPLSIVEAMARGCVPVAAEMDSGIPEVISSGENGMIVPGRDYDEWARQIVDLWRDRRRLARMSQQARSTVRERFTVEHAADQFEALLERIGADAAAATPRRPAALHWGVERSTTGDVLPPPSIVRPSSVHIGGLRRWR